MKSSQYISDSAWTKFCAFYIELIIKYFPGFAMIYLFLSIEKYFNILTNFHYSQNIVKLIMFVLGTILIRISIYITKKTYKPKYILEGQETKNDENRIILKPLEYSYRYRNELIINANLLYYYFGCLVTVIIMTMSGDNYNFAYLIYAFSGIFIGFVAFLVTAIMSSKDIKLNIVLKLIIVILSSLPIYLYIAKAIL